jgi:hypothetical protein
LKFGWLRTPTQKAPQRSWKCGDFSWNDDVGVPVRLGITMSSKSD